MKENIYRFFRSKSAVILLVLLICLILVLTVLKISITTDNISQGYLLSYPDGNSSESFQSYSNDLLHSLKLPIGWEVWGEDLDMAGFTRTGDLYKFSQQECEKSQWKDNDMCKYLNQSFVFPVVSKNLNISAFITLHKAIDQEKAQTLINEYLTDVQDARNNCKGGVLVSKDKSYFININQSEGDDHSDLYEILSNLADLSGFEVIHSCQSN